MDSGHSKQIHPLLSEISDLASKHKLVPFLGAGCSFQHIGLDWNLLAAEMANQIFGDPKESPIAIAQKYVDAFSRERFCELLTDKLVIKEFEDAKGETLLAIMSLNLGVIYTTNQDNVFELCCNKYGRTYKSVATLDDLSGVLPGERMLIKFHGDLKHPESIVFTDSDYANRIANEDHFLNIRLKSDLLTKNFIFIGYSFRDPNIQQTFSSLNELFRGKLPPAYLIPWKYEPQLEELTDKYGVKIVNTEAIFPDVKSNAEAFDRFFIELAKATHAKKTSEQIDDLFDSKKPNSQRMLGKHEVIALESSADSDNCADAILKFRALCDLTLIPVEYSERIVDVLLKIASKVSNNEESDAFSAALFNLGLTNPQHRLRVLAAAFATANVRAPQSGFNRFRPHIKGIGEDINLLIVALAIDMFRGWGQSVSEGFRSCVSGWVDSAKGVNEFPPEIQQAIREQINWAWTTGTFTPLENPIARMERLDKLPDGRRSLFGRSHEQITADLMGMMPKEFKKPYEE